MSMILKGIDMPNSGEIELIIRPHGKVLSKTRGIYAEAIQVPKGARLIDANAMLKDLNRRLDKTNNIYKGEEMDLFISELVKQCEIDIEIRTLREWISSQPTISESEEE